MTFANQKLNIFALILTLVITTSAHPISNCTNGVFECIGDVVFQCNLGTRVLLNDCRSQGLVCNADFECVHPGDSSLNTTIPLRSPNIPQIPTGSCTNGAFECVGDVVFQCNLGTWVLLNNCRHQGLVCNADFECVRPGDSSLNTTIPLRTPNVPQIPTGNCTNGAFECVGDVVFQCNLGTWVLNNNCRSQGLVCNADFECVHPGDSSLNTMIPLRSPNIQTPLGSCTNGAFECVGDVVFQCNLGTWVLNNNCRNQGLVCNADFECVHPNDSSLNTTVQLRTPNVPPQPPTDSCTNGAFECVGDVVFQCNLGTWVLNNNCRSQGLVCNADFECVHPVK
jgi:hypothetical protein